MSELLDRWQTGDEAAAAAIFQRYSQRLCALAEAQIGHRLAQRVGPDDVAQSVFRTFFRRARNGEFHIDHSTSLWHLLVKIAINKIHKQAERHTAQIRDVNAEVGPTPDGFIPDVAAQEPSPAEAVALADEIESVLKKFRPHEVEMFRLCLEGFTAEEICQRVGTSRWTVRRTLDQIGKHLEQRLEFD